MLQSPRPLGSGSEVKMSGPTALSSKLTNADTSSILTNNQQKFPLNAMEASKMFEKYLTEYEKREIFEYQTVYYFN